MLLQNLNMTLSCPELGIERRARKVNDTQKTKKSTLMTVQMETGRVMRMRRPKRKVRIRAQQPGGLGAAESTI